MRLAILILALALTPPLAAAPRHWQAGDALDKVMLQWRSASPSAADLAAEAGRLGLPSGPKGDPIAALHAQAGAQFIQRTALLPIDVVQLRAGLSAADIDRALDIYRASPLVLSAEPDPPIRAAALPNDSVFTAGYQWGLTHTAWIQAYQAYPSAFSFHSVITVAVLDTGVGPHSDLPTLLSGTSFVSGVTATTDDNGHGTFCSGLIAATPNNGAGIAGAFIDPSDIRVLPVKVLDHNGGGTYDSIVSGILYAVDQGARVLNISIQGYADSDILHAAVVEADQRGAVLVAAAGNDSREAAWPAAFGSVISVGALDDQDQPASYSNTGKLDLSAPGGAGLASCGCSSAATAFCPHEIWSLCPNDRFEGGAGTSFAAPLVSAAAAMLLAQDSSLRPLDVMQRLVRSASATSQGPGFHAQSGWGKLNFYAALTLSHASGAGSGGTSLRIYNWPNPFSIEKDGGTNFTFFLPQAQAAELRLLDDGGDLVRHWSLDAGQTYAGMNLVHWDGLNGAGRKAANGGYRLLLLSEGARATCRVAVLR